MGASFTYDGAEYDITGVVGFVCETLSAVSATGAEVDGDGKSGGTRGDVHGSSSSEIETTHDVGPSLGVPGPARNRIVDESGPEEDEDNHGSESTALRDGTDGEDWAETGCLMKRVGSAVGQLT